MKVDTSTIIVRLDRVLIREMNMQEITGTGFIVPNTAKADHAGSYGEIVGVGPDAVGLEVGQMVLFDQYGGHEAHLNGSVHRCIRAESVSLILPRQSDADAQG